MSSQANYLRGAAKRCLHWRQIRVLMERMSYEPNCAVPCSVGMILDTWFLSVSVHVCSCSTCIRLGSAIGPDARATHIGLALVLRGICVGGAPIKSIKEFSHAFPCWIKVGFARALYGQYCVSFVSDL